MNEKKGIRWDPNKQKAVRGYALSTDQKTTVEGLEFFFTVCVCVCDAV